MKSITWKIVVWSLRILPILAIAAFLHFYLPGKDVVRVVDTDVKRMDVVSKNFVKEDATGRFAQTRDVRFINTAWPNGKPRVYRNEETDWHFPWYFKFDSGNLQTLAQDLRSTKDKPAWVAITHYGWRIELFSMFPNAVEIKPVEGPEVFLTPWFNIGFFALFGLLAVYLWRLYRRFVVTKWLPFMERLDLDERFDNAGNGFAQLWRWLTANFRDRSRRS